MYKKTIIGSREFHSKKTAKKHFQDMLGKYKAGQQIDNADDHDDLIALVDCLDQVLIEGGEEPKGSQPISHFEKRINQPYGTAGFWLVREDGSATDFSYILAVDGPRRLKTRIQFFYDACRNIVKPDIDEFRESKRDEQGMFICNITHKRLFDREAHVDHEIPTFGKIVVDFRHSKGWSHKIPEGIVTDATDAQPITNFSNLAVANEFREYHKQKAKLRIISAKTNLQMAHKAKIA